MKRLFFVIAVSVLVGGSVFAQQDSYTSKTIFANYRASIVRVQVVATNPEKKQVIVNLGTGFIISGNLIVTANHVVNPREWGLRYMPGIQIQLSNGKVVKATPILETPSTDTKLYDYAVLRAAEPLNTPTLRLGTWKEAKEADQLSTIGYALNLPEPVLLSVMASACFTADGIDVIVFQGPNNRGLSGAPLISNRTGNVVGIVTSRLVGISEKLADIRREAAKGGGAKIDGVNPSEAVVELTNALDSYLMSGMGAAVAIDYVAASVPK